MQVFAYEYVKKRNFSIDCFKYLTSSRSMRTKASYDYTVNFDEKTAKERISYMQRNIYRYIHRYVEYVVSKICDNGMLIGV